MVVDEKLPAFLFWALARKPYGPRELQIGNGGSRRKLSKGHKKFGIIRISTN
jgi:hypothetical protein